MWEGEKALVSNKGTSPLCDCENSETLRRFVSSSTDLSWGEGWLAMQVLTRRSLAINIHPVSRLHHTSAVLDQTLMGVKHADLATQIHTLRRIIPTCFYLHYGSSVKKLGAKWIHNIHTGHQDISVQYLVLTKIHLHEIWGSASVSCKQERGSWEVLLMIRPV